MQADVKIRRPVCFFRLFPQCFSRFQTLELPPDRHHSWPSSDDPPTVWPDPGPKLSPFSESLGKRGYTKVAIGGRVENERRISFFSSAIKSGKRLFGVPERCQLG